jgi:hypothetical protein
MKSCAILTGCLISGFASLAAAQPSSDRITLPAVAGQSSPSESAFAIAFVDSPPVCPQHHSALQIAGGAVWFIRSLLPNSGASFGRIADDETWDYRLSADDCVLDITVRVQVYRDGRWESLLVPRWSRPSLTPDQRLTPEDRRSLEHFRKVLAARLAARRDARVDRQAEATTREAWQEGPGNLARKIRIRRQSGAVSSFLEFEGMPENCVDVVGEYRLDQRGIAFQFPTNFPDGLNQFETEFHRFDDFRGRLALIQGGCRVEITVGKAIRDHGRWMPIPIASIARLR